MLLYRNYIFYIFLSTRKSRCVCFALGQRFTRNDDSESTQFIWKKKQKIVECTKMSLFSLYFAESLQQQSTIAQVSFFFGSLGSLSYTHTQTHTYYLMLTTITQFSVYRFSFIRIASKKHELE